MVMEVLHLVSTHRRDSLFEHLRRRDRVARNKEPQPDLAPPAETRSWIGSRVDPTDDSLDSIMSKNTKTQFLKTTAIGGVLFLLPFVAILVVVAEAVKMMQVVAQPLSGFLPVDSVDDAISFVQTLPSPLSTYLFSRDRGPQDRLSASIRTGAIVSNATLLQFVQPFGPFGGEGNSGIGRSHGEAGFKAFSNEQVVLRRRWGSWILRLLQPPYSDRTSRLSRIFRHFT